MENTRIKQKSIWFPALLLALLTFFYFADIIFSDKIFSFRDLSRYYYPLRQFAFSQLKGGVFPFWNPYISSGHPLFAALQSVVLYPLSIIYLLPNFDFAFNFFIIIHIFLAGLFFYFLMYDLKFSHISSLISAISFMFGGYLIAVINLTTTLAAAVWFPLVFLFYNKALKEKRYLYLLLSSIFLGIMFLGGEPTPMYATIFIIGIYSFIQALPFRRDSFKITRIFLIFVLVFILLFSFQILPLFELIKISHRTRTLFSDNTHWSFPPRDIINFLLPFFYGPLHLQGDTPLRQDWLLLSYMGVIPLMLFLSGFIFRKDGYANFFKLTFILGLFFVFGKFTSAYNLMYKFLPGMSLIRFPVKFFFISAVSFSFLAGCGWEECSRRIMREDVGFLKVIKGIFIWGFICSILFLLLHTYKDFILNLALFKNIKNSAALDINIFNLKRALVFFMLGSLVLFFGLKRKIRIHIAGSVLILLIFIDLYGAKNIDVNPAVSKGVFHKKTPNIMFLMHENGLFRIYTSHRMNKNNDILFGGQTYEEALEKSIDHFTCNRLIQCKIYDARGYLSLHNLNYSKVLNLADTAPLPSSTNILNMLNVKYILTPDEINDSRYRLVHQSNDSYLYENLDYLERAYFVSNYIVLKEEQAISDKLKSKEFEPDKVVILEEEPRDGSVFSSDKPVKKTEPSLCFLKYEPNEVIIEANVSDKPKFLVLADNYYPGWKVFVDDNPDKIYKANFTLRAVYLAPGIHTVRFIFSPGSFKIGALISLGTVLILGTVLFFQAISLSKKQNRPYVFLL